jgi:outer membrane lipoprotein SlyB
MKNFIGGLFKSRENAERARHALQERGLDTGSITMLQCTHDKEAVMLKKNPSIKTIGKGALTGVLILGGVGAAIGLLVGVGVVHVPSLDSSSSQALPFQITWQFILAATLAGFFLGALTGAILGAATRLAMTRYHKVENVQQPSKGDLLLAVQANDTNRVNDVKSTMQANGAVSFKEFSDKWDPEIWSELDESTTQVR